MDSLIGNRYGKLVVLRRGDDYVFEKSGYHLKRYVCQCDCGNKTLTREKALISGKVTSCGCARNDSLIGKNVIDMVGKRFGTWTVLSQDGVNGNREAVWNCRCDCGNERKFTRRALTTGKRLICKNCHNTNADAEIAALQERLVGSRFGRWTVQKFAGTRWSEKSKREYRKWTCVCDCGTVRDVDEQSLLRHKSVSCGCWRKERVAKSATFDDLSGRRFGHLEVLKRNGSRHYPGGGQAQMYLCKCDCGRTTEVARSMLVSGQTESCGCQCESKMEQWVRQYCDEHLLQYEPQKSFDDLVGVGNGLLKYDFAIFDGADVIGLIECQGEQHYHPVDWFGGQERFDILVEHDVRKRKYALEHGVQFLELSYKLTKDVFIGQLDSFINSLKSESRSDDIACNEQRSNGS